jgi:hypothetical protein
MVCQRVAPTFQQASRKLRGTLASASRVLAMMTGSDPLAGGDDGVPEAGGVNERAETEQGVDDAGHAREVDDGEVDDAVEPVFLRVFVQVDGGENPDRRGDGEGEEDEVERADQRGPDAAGRHAAFRHLEEELEIEGRGGADDQVADDQQQGQDHGRGHGEENPFGHGFLPELAAHRRSLGKPGLVGGGAHFRRMPRTMVSAMRLTPKVRVKSRTPVRKSTR